MTKAKERWGVKSHFEGLNKRLKKINPINVEPDFRDDIYTHYAFDLLHPSDYDQWFYNLSKGLL